MIKKKKIKVEKLKSYKRVTIFGIFGEKIDEARLARAIAFEFNTAVCVNSYEGVKKGKQALAEIKEKIKE